MHALLLTLTQYVLKEMLRFNQSQHYRDTKEHANCEQATIHFCTHQLKTSMNELATKQIQHYSCVVRISNSGSQASSVKISVTISRMKRVWFIYSQKKE